MYLSMHSLKRGSIHLQNASQTAHYWGHLTAGDAVGEPDLRDWTDPGSCVQFDMDRMRAPKGTLLEIHGNGSKK